MGNHFAKRSHFNNTPTVVHSDSEQNGFASHPVDPTFLSAAVIATINNNVGLLSSLFQLGLPLLDSRDNEGNTILHISVINERYYTCDSAT
jgi:ankyrin repeat protein